MHLRLFGYKWFHVFPLYTKAYYSLLHLFLFGELTLPYLGYAQRNENVGRVSNVTFLPSKDSHAQSVTYKNINER